MTFSNKTRILPVLDILTSLVILFGLLPMAGGLPGIASQGQPVMDGVWFTINLGGALLLLASGLKALLRKTPLHRFVFLYAFLIGVLGTLRLQIVGFGLLIPGWLLLAFCVGVMLLSIRRPWFWTIGGIIWCMLVLGVWSAGGIMAYSSASAPQFPFYLPLQILAWIFVVVLLVLHFRFRDVQYDAY